MEFVRWVKELNQALSGKSEEDKQKIFANPPVPEMTIVQLSDHNEIEPDS